jgi:hypothetical protein
MGSALLLRSDFAGSAYGVWLARHAMSTGRRGFWRSLPVILSLSPSNSVWLVGIRMAGARSSQMHRVSAGDTSTLLRLLDGLQTRGREQGTPSCIAVCFEAGRDGFWLHRLLMARDIPTYVVELTSILVNRRANRARPIGSMPKGCCGFAPPIS